MQLYMCVSSPGSVCYHFVFSPSSPVCACPETVLRDPCTCQPPPFPSFICSYTPWPRSNDQKCVYSCRGCKLTDRGIAVPLQAGQDVLSGPGAHPVSYHEIRGVKLTTHLQLWPRLRIREANLYPCVRLDGLLLTMKHTAPRPATYC
jgi:hypothetical protein